MPASEITSLVENLDTKAPKVSSIMPGEPIPLTSLLENNTKDNTDPRVTIWQSMSSIPPEIANGVYETVKGLPQDIFKQIATEMIRTYRHSILSNTNDTQLVEGSDASTVRLSREKEKQLLRGSTFNILSNHYLVDYLGRKNGLKQH
jgi:hypothetical protein